MSKSDLLRLRAVTVVDRGSDGEIDDFRWLWSEVAKLGRSLPGLDAVLPFSRDIIHANPLKSLYHDLLEEILVVAEVFRVEIISNRVAEKRMTEISRNVLTWKYGQTTRNSETYGGRTPTRDVE